MSLLVDIAACRVCEAHLPLGPRPVLRTADPAARVLIIGQAPGTKVHVSGIPWDDASGQRLRDWMQVTPDAFYDQSRFAILPMGLCYPGRAVTSKGGGGDNPPRPECAPLWHARVRKTLPNIQLTLLIGAYAQGYYLNDCLSLTERVRQADQYGAFFPLVHPSPRNRLWLSRNPWFDAEILSRLRARLRGLGL
ncbi:uracil-DNA glycosylase family protein [Asticcacaulis excentricus]|uniref:Uracil-DNA glycosylase superfamily n=1 Tax=Asticcacaulis excentricus (strain ATCC 15261 / DSM 4724 / KCTC 12464 / NCIMB 9791 / VKM B-1370 / CB 48) TaxID=573065 RepID=E8RUD0_ASTEC|nr:uracil-DNA glycosylase family protein [Asticcacaulis excentricus]ADU15101.1 Uracil-DNA glycosylase superfamily [Asticcacaulis excentricus CB 48]